MPRSVTISKNTLFRPSVEIVERKGLGHPDTLCDKVMEQVSVELSQEYLTRFGSMAHFNVDKGLLAAGVSKTSFGGGKVLTPMTFYMGDRATFKVGKETVNVNKIATQAIQNWMTSNIINIKKKDLSIKSVIGKTSSSLNQLYSKSKVTGSNDTSAAVGYAPFSETEQMVLDLEHYLNSKSFKKQFPETGEDVKVMALKQNTKTSLTIAMAFVDKYVKNEQDYFRKKDEVLEALKHRFEVHSLNLNTLDKKGNGEAGCYLSVTGLSADGGDSGEVGRGNRVNGLIPLMRPAGSEAAAGKNPFGHVGKIYSILSNELAKDIQTNVSGADQVTIWLLTKIGHPIDQPLVNVSIHPNPRAKLKDIEPQVKQRVNHSLDNINKFCKQLAKGKYDVC
ncbi:MAG: S-adenosylmethionine synthetase [Candidatus Diapherotrites archaeon]|nr:S-adenosylmethionine synthetase [Candidatus Diapherotrites archaeon]